MKRLLCIGEALIDFIPQQSGVAMKDVESFSPLVGGAPANVCGAFVKLGGEGEMITKLGDDPFGDKIVEEFETFHIGCQYIKRTKKANTSLAFVALKGEGSREFSFYRKPGADMLFEADEVEEEWFEDCFCFHFCSVSLGDYPMKGAHSKAIEYARSHGALISFDPNLRFQLWEDTEQLKKTVWEFLPKADVLKISDEELEFITGETNPELALPKLFIGNVRLVIYTEGPKGARAYTKNTKASAEGVKVAAVDTTGAGDGFMGAFLYQMYRDDVTVESVDSLTEEQLASYLAFANRYCAKSVMAKGGLPSYPTMEEM